MEQGYTPNVQSVVGQHGGGEFSWTLPQPESPSSRSTRAKSETGEAGPKSLRRNAIMRKIYEQKDREEETTKQYEKAMNEAKSVQSLAPPALCRKKSNSLPDLARLHEQGLIHQLWQQHGPTLEGSSEALGSRAASPIRRSPCHGSPRMSPYPSVWPHSPSLSNDSPEQHLPSSLPKPSFMHSSTVPQFFTATPMSSNFYTQGSVDSPPIPSLMVTSPEEETASILWNEMDMQEADCTSVEELTDILATLIDTQGSATSTSPKIFNGMPQAAQTNYKTSTTANHNPFTFQSSPVPSYQQPHLQQASTFTVNPSFSAVTNGGPRKSHGQQASFQQMQNYGTATTGANNYGSPVLHPNQYVYLTSTNQVPTLPAISVADSAQYLWIPPSRARVSSMPSLRHFATSQTDTTAFCGGVVEDLAKPEEQPEANIIPTIFPTNLGGQGNLSYHNYDFYNQGSQSSSTKTESETFIMPTPIQTWNAASFDCNDALDLLNSLSECKFGQSGEVNVKAQEASDYMERLRLADNYARKELGIAVSDPDFL